MDEPIIKGEFSFSFKPSKIDEEKNLPPTIPTNIQIDTSFDERMKVDEKIHIEPRDEQLRLKQELEYIENTRKKVEEIDE